jgi:predicted  nucleic acid-binding Zn-ribbon protein
MTEDSERVADLEQRVEELEATVRGLTEELVDASERIRSLEAELDQSPSTDELREAREEPVPGENADAQAPEGEADEATKRADGEADDNEESALDDIIVA